MNKDRNWYERKWHNRRALISRERRQEKYGVKRREPDLNDDRTEPLTRGGGIEGIIAEVQSSYVVVLHGDEYYRVSLSDIETLNAGVQLVVGDRVLFDRIDEHAVIRDVLPRFSKLARVRVERGRRSEFLKQEHILVANIDVAIIVAAAASPPFHPRLIDRYLILCQYGNVSPVICINKLDLVDKPPDLSVYTSMGVPAVYVSASSGLGMDELLSHVTNKVSVLTGHSGVGKSSIVNWLLGAEVLRVGEVGGHSGRGRHTTVTSTLHRRDENTYLIDTPGIRALAFWKADKVTLKFYFPEFAPYAPECRFRNCSHTHEPDCAVKAAARAGLVSPARYDSYLRLMSE